MDVPETVRTALADQPVAGCRCLEAGAGAGNATAGLLEADAKDVIAITDDPTHARTVRDRIHDDRASVLRADLRSIPLADDAVEFVTAHALFNVVPPADAATIAAELTRVAARDARLVVDDYSPIEGGRIRELFAVENALAELARGRPALTFYPVAHLRGLFEGHGWTLDRRATLLDPVPWTESHLQAHLAVARAFATDLPDAVADPLLDRGEQLAEEIGSADVGRMYSLAFVRQGTS